uniref:Uncharacterized protein n=1 Tax=Anguilla anguilla TaxID=7936 RepID=A0A0E9XMS6_ANGAN
MELGEIFLEGPLQYNEYNSSLDFTGYRLMSGSLGIIIIKASLQNIFPKKQAKSRLNRPFT